MLFSKQNYTTYLPMHGQWRSASFFLRENKTKNLRPNEFTNCYAERENQRISFFVIKTKPQRNMVVSIILSITFFMILSSMHLHIIYYIFL